MPVAEPVQVEVLRGPVPVTVEAWFPEIVRFAGATEVVSVAASRLTKGAWPPGSLSTVKRARKTPARSEQEVWLVQP
jgi:hypothetical protein